MPKTHVGRQDRVPILIVLHGDGWVEVFGQRHVDAYIAIMPFVATPQAQIAAEEYLERRLPFRHRRLYWPGMRRAADLVRVVRPSDITRRDYQLGLLRSITEAAQTLRVRGGEKMVWTIS